MTSRSGVFAVSRKVLFIEHDDELRNLYVELARALGVVALLADRCEHGLAKARRERPDAVVIDTGRHLVASSSLARVWRTVAPGASLVAVTTNSCLTRESFLELGFDDVLLKPFSLERFDGVITRALEHTRGRRRLAV